MALVRLVSWVKREIVTKYVGAAHLNTVQYAEDETKLANPTSLVDAVGLTQPTLYHLGPLSGYPLFSIARAIRMRIS